MNARIKGYMLGVAASVAYGTNPALAVPLYREGLDVISVLLLRYTIALPMILVLWRFSKKSHSLPKRGQGLKAFGLGVLMVLSSITLYASYKYMDVGVASSLLFIYPLLVALIMALFFRERIGWLTAVCLVGASIGVTMLCESSGPSVVTATGVWLVMLSSLSYALYIVGVKMPSMRGMDNITLTLWVLLAGVLVLCGWAAVSGGVTLPHTAGGWLCATGLALLPTLISLLCTNAAIESIGSTATAALGAFEPVTAVAAGVILLGERMSLIQYAGLLLVLGCVTMVICRNRKA